VKMILALFGFFFTSLGYAQTWLDEDFMLPKFMGDPDPEEIFLFGSDNLKSVDIFYVNPLSAGASKDLDKVDKWLLTRSKFDDDGRLVSDQAYTVQSYLLEADLYLGQHTITYTFNYPKEDEMVVSMEDTESLTKFSWIYKDSLLVDCRKFQGAPPQLQLYWTFDYANDTLIQRRKYNANSALLGLSQFIYDQIHHIHEQ
jgi:hypothetical protein